MRFAFVPSDGSFFKSSRGAAEIVKPYVLCVAGEPSGDRIGQEVVRAFIDAGIQVRGVGGPRMQLAGLSPLVEYSGLAVNGIVDVMLRLPLLCKRLKVLENALCDEACCGLICVDYPGFNMRLYRQAKALGKPTFWIAPPQIWAWKKKRVKEFEGQLVHVFFPWEFKAYLAGGAIPVLVSHSLCDEAKSPELRRSNFRLVLFPGSRWPQALRNGSAYLQVAKSGFPGEIVMVAPDAEMKRKFQGKWGGQLSIIEANEIFPQFWTEVTHAICPPGTGSLELALREIRVCVYSRIDLVTYAFGRLLLRIKMLALPNLLLGQMRIPEILEPALGNWGKLRLKNHLAGQWSSLPSEEEARIAKEIRGSLGGIPIRMAVSEFISRHNLDKT